MHRERRAVAASPGHDAADTDDAGLAAGVIAGEIAGMARAVWFWHQLADVEADRLFLGVAEQPLGCRAEELDGAAAVDHDHRVGHGVQDRAEMLLAQP